MKTEEFSQSEAQEVSVPVTFEDFGVGDRVWYYDSKKFSNIFGVVVSVNRVDSNMVFRSDAGVYAIISDDWGKGTAGYPPVFKFCKSLDITSLSVGDRISKSTDWGDGSRSRVYAVISSVSPVKSLGVTLERTEGDHMINGGRPPEEHLIKEQEKGDTIEYQMAGWELEA